jgi:hypothetical protein
MSSSAFQRIVSRETVLGLGIKPYEWDDEDQADTSQVYDSALEGES